MHVPEIDKSQGMEVYATESPGIGGTIRKSPEDFAVEEVLVDQSKASIEIAAVEKALGASASRQHYLLCVLVKRNWDTFVVIRNLAKQLGINQERIQVAGLKDAKAVTAQHISIEGASMEDLSRIHVKDVEVRPIGYFRAELSPFYLSGNNFRIRIRGIALEPPVIEERIAETTAKLESVGGIPNFFGHQRFGTTRSVTHLVGKAIVKGNFEHAALLLLAEPSPYEHPSSKMAREELRSKRDFKQALQNFPKQLRFERLMLRHLAERPDDFVGAFQRFPPRLQKLFVQAYQSYLFNRFLSERIRSGFPLNKAEAGDYVTAVDRSGLPMTRAGKLANREDLAEINAKIAAGKMRVALPLVGYGQVPSEGAMGDIERSTLEAENVKPEDFRVGSSPEMSGKGELRPIVSPVRDFKICKVLPSRENQGEQEVELGFMLLRGSYATMLLRELMKPTDPVAAGF